MWACRRTPIDGQIRVSTFNDLLDEGAVLGAWFIVPAPHPDCILALSLRLRGL